MASLPGYAPAAISCLPHLAELDGCPVGNEARDSALREALLEASPEAPLLLFRRLPSPRPAAYRPAAAAPLLSNSPARGK